MIKKIKIKQFLAGRVNNMPPGFELADSDSIFELGLVNSLFALQLVGFIEKEFSITLSNEDISIENFTSVETIHDMILKYDLAGNENNGDC